MAWYQLSVYCYLELNWFKHNIYNPWENADPGMQTTYYQSQFEQIIDDQIMECRWLLELYYILTTYNHHQFPAKMSGLGDDQSST